MSRHKAPEDGEGEIDHPSSDFWFNSWLICTGPLLVDLAADVTDQYLQATQKVRAHKADQKARVAAIVSTLIANLFRFHHEAHEADRIAVPTGHAKVTRYQRPEFQQIGPIVDFMATAGFIQKFPAHSHKRRTGIAAKGDLLATLTDPALGHRHDDVKELEGRETIILRARTGRRIADRQESMLVDYEDTAETHALRREMVEINTFLLRQEIELHGTRQGNVTLTRRFHLRTPDEPLGFDLHGRLYGAFWVNLKKEKRSGLRLNGEPLAVLDFRSMFPRLAYLHAGAEPPAGDLYDIRGLEDHRDGAKAGLSALLSTKAEMQRLSPEVKEKLPPGWTASRLWDAMALKHPALVPLFGRDLGLSFMFTESRIMIAALQDLMRKGIPALPIHDGMLVAISKAEEAAEAMKRASLEVVGMALPVERKAERPD